MRIDRVKFATELAKKDITLKRFAEITALSRSTLSSVKNGKSCSEKTAYTIAKGLGVDVAEIVKQEG